MKSNVYLVLCLVSLFCILPTEKFINSYVAMIPLILMFVSFYKSLTSIGD
jgi:hypothetical protein